MTKTITLAMLCAADACEEGKAAFTDACGESAEVTLEWCLAHAETLDFNWGLGYLLPGKARETAVSIENMMWKPIGVLHDMADAQWDAAQKSATPHGEKDGEYEKYWTLVGSARKARNTLEATLFYIMVEAYGLKEF